MKTTSRILKFLYIMNAFLILVFSGSFLLSEKGSTPPKRETALLNPRDRESIRSVTIKDGTGTVTLTDTGSGIWTGKSSGKKEIWPCDTDRVSMLMENFTKIIKVYKISDNKSLWKDF